jgi:hypothetical protein
MTLEFVAPDKLVFEDLCHQRSDAPHIDAPKWQIARIRDLAWRYSVQASLKDDVRGAAGGNLIRPWLAPFAVRAVLERPPEAAYIER